MEPVDVKQEYDSGGMINTKKGGKHMGLSHAQHVCVCGHSMLTHELYYIVLASSTSLHHNSPSLNSCLKIFKIHEYSTAIVLKNDFKIAGHAA